MAPLPKKRHSNTRKRIRRDAIKHTMAGLIDCPNCKKKMHPHVVCPHCGFYNGREVVKQKEEAKVTVSRAE